jgi:hypothetical protein
VRRDIIENTFHKKENKGELMHKIADKRWSGDNGVLTFPFGKKFWGRQAPKM